MYTIQKPWKEVSISLPNLETFARSEFSTFVGCSANSMLELHFSEEPSQEQKDMIDSYYESLDGSDYVSFEEQSLACKKYEDAILAMKMGLISKTWANMSTVERKIVVGLIPTRQEMGL